MVAALIGPRTVRVWSMAQALTARPDGRGEPWHRALALDMDPGVEDVVSLQFVDDEVLVCVGQDGRVRAWHLAPLPTRAHAPLASEARLSHGTYRAFDARGQQVVSSEQLRATLIWEFDCGERVARALFYHEEGHWKSARCVLVGVGGELWSLDMLPTQALRVRRLGRIDGELARGAAMSPDGRMVAIATRDGRVGLWRADGKRASASTPQDDTEGALGVLHSERRELWSLAFSNKGERLVGGGMGGALLIWRLDRASAPPLINDDHQGCISDLSWSLDDEVIISASWDRTVRLTRARTLITTTTLRGHHDYVAQARMIEGAGMLVSVGYDRQIIFWRDRAFAPVARFELHRDWLQSVQVLDPGGIIVAASRDRTLSVWHSDQPGLLSVLGEREGGDAMRAAMSAQSAAGEQLARAALSEVSQIMSGLGSGASSIALDDALGIHLDALGALPEPEFFNAPQELSSVSEDLDSGFEDLPPPPPEIPSTARVVKRHEQDDFVLDEVALDELEHNASEADRAIDAAWEALSAPSEVMDMEVRGRSDVFLEREGAEFSAPISELEPPSDALHDVAASEPMDWEDEHRMPGNQADSAGEDEWLPPGSERQEPSRAWNIQQIVGESHESERTEAWHAPGQLGAPQSEPHEVAPDMDPEPPPGGVVIALAETSDATPDTLLEPAEIAEGSGESDRADKASHAQEIPAPPEPLQAEASLQEDSSEPVSVEMILEEEELPGSSQELLLGAGPAGRPHARSTDELPITPRLPRAPRPPAPEALPRGERVATPLFSAPVILNHPSADDEVYEEVVAAPEAFRNLEPEEHSTIASEDPISRSTQVANMSLMRPRSFASHASHVSDAELSAPSHVSDAFLVTPVEHVTWSRLWGVHLAREVPAAQIFRRRRATGQGFALQRELDVRATPLHRLRVHPSRRLVAVCGEGSDVDVWTLGGEQVQRFRTPAQVLHTLCLSRDGRVLFAAGDDAAIHAWCERDDGIPMHTSLHAHEGTITSLALHPDERRLLSGSVDGTVLLWSLVDGTVLHTMRHGAPVLDVCFGPEGIISVGADRTLRRWTPAGQPRDASQTDEAVLGIEALGDSVLAATANGTLYALRQGKWQIDRQHARAIRAVAISPEGLIATAAADGAVAISVAGQEPHQIVRVGKRLRSMDLSAGHLVVGTQDGAVEVFARDASTPLA